MTRNCPFEAKTVRSGRGLTGSQKRVYSSARFSQSQASFSMSEGWGFAGYKRRVISKIRQFSIGSRLVNVLLSSAMSVYNPRYLYTNVIPATEHTPFIIDTTHPDYEMVQPDLSDDEAPLPIVPEEKKMDKSGDELQLPIVSEQKKMEQIKKVTKEQEKEVDENEDEAEKNHFLNYFGLVSKNYIPPPKPLNVGKKILRNRLVDITLPYLPAHSVTIEQQVDQQKKNSKGKSLLVPEKKLPKSKAPQKSKLSASKKKSKSSKMSPPPPAYPGANAPVFVYNLDPTKPSCSFWYPAEMYDGLSKPSAKKPAASVLNSSRNSSNTSKPSAKKSATSPPNPLCNTPNTSKPSAKKSTTSSPNPSCDISNISKGSSKTSAKKPATSPPNSTYSSNTSKGPSKTSSKKPATSTPKSKQKPTSPATSKCSEPHPINVTKNDLDQSSLPSTSKYYKDMSKKELLDALVEKLTARLQETALQSESSSSAPADQTSTPESTEHRKSIPVSVIKYAPPSNDKSKCDASESEKKGPSNETFEFAQPKTPDNSERSRHVRKAVRRNNPKLNIGKADNKENVKPADDKEDARDSSPPPEPVQPENKGPDDFIFGRIKYRTYNRLIKMDFIKQGYNENVRKIMAIKEAPQPRTKKEIKEANMVIRRGVPRTSDFHPKDSRLDANFIMKYERDPTKVYENPIEIRKKAKFELQIKDKLLEAIVKYHHNPNMARCVSNSGLAKPSERELNNLASRKSRMKQILMTTVLENSVLAQRKQLEVLRELKTQIGQKPPYKY